MANYYSDASRADDTGAGTSWGTAKKTVSAGLALCTVAGDILNIAPGTYTDTSVVPAVAGNSGAWCKILGDVDGVLGSGKTGRIVFNSNPWGSSNNWDYWQVDGLSVLGSYMQFG